MVGDGEAETGPLATSWHSNKFLNPIRDGAVLPVLHLNGYKIANPTILARISREELEALLTGYGHKPYFVEGDEPEAMHQKMAATLEHCVGEIRAIQQQARESWPCRAAALADDRAAVRRRVGRDRRKWTGIAWRVLARAPGADSRSRHQRQNLQLVEDWMRSYRPEELFDENGPLVAELRELAPDGLRAGSAPILTRTAGCCARRSRCRIFASTPSRSGRPRHSYVSPTATCSASFSAKSCGAI